jgi:hypothetical protein
MGTKLKAMLVLIAVLLPVAGCDKPAKAKPGAYCSQPGQHGTYHGVEYTCSAGTGTDKPRWRR